MKRHLGNFLIGLGLVLEDVGLWLKPKPAGGERSNGRIDAELHLDGKRAVDSLAQPFDDRGAI